MLLTLCRCYFHKLLLPHCAYHNETFMYTRCLQRWGNTNNNNKSKHLAQQKKNKTKTTTVSKNNNNNCLTETTKNIFQQQQEERSISKLTVIIILLVHTIINCVIRTPAAAANWKNDINLTPPKEQLKLTTLTLPLPLTLTLALPVLPKLFLHLQLQFLAALVHIFQLLVITILKSELHHMLCDLIIQRHTAAITDDLSETPAKKGAPPIPQERSKSFELCMNSKRRTISHRTSSNRHRKLQPFRYT